MTQEDYNRLERITQKDQVIDKIIRLYVPCLCFALLFICADFIARYCHAMQADPPMFFRPRRVRTIFIFQRLFFTASFLLFLTPGIRFEQDPLTIDRWKLIPHKLPSLFFFGLSLYLLLTQPSRAFPEAEALRLYRLLSISVILIICIAGRILIYVLYHTRKCSPYFNKTSVPLPYDKLLFVVITLLPLIAVVVIDYHFDRVAFPHRY